MTEPERIMKRNGDMVDFNKYKICNAMKRQVKKTLITFYRIEVYAILPMKLPISLV